MKDAREGVALNGKIRVLHWPFDAARVGRAKEIRQTKILPLHTHFVIQRSLIRGDNAAPALYKFTQLLALRIGKRGNVGKNQRLERARVFLVEQAIMHHFKGNARLDQRMIVS